MICILLISTLLCMYSVTFCNQSQALAQIQQHESLIAQDPGNANAHFAFGQYLAELDRKEYYDKAFFHFKKATTLQPRNAQWLFSLGTFCCRIGLLQESLAAYQKILSHNPSLISVLYNAGFTFKVAGDVGMATNIYKHILSRKPDYDPAHLGLAFAYLAQGDYQNGWNAHTWNLKKQGKDSQELRSFLQNNTIAGKRILLVAEGGLGDTINFIRYAQRLKQMGAYTIVAAQSPLLPLLSRCPYIDSLIPTNGVTLAYDAKTTLMSLPTLFHDDEESIPQNIPYIFPDPERIAYWKEQLQGDTNFKIGICWQPDLHNDVSRLPIARRGIPLSFFYTLGSTPGITLYSLQKHEGLDQLRTVPTEVTLKTFDESFDAAHGSFMDTAALMHSLDLIISTDTATAHLAGAMGKRVWLLLPYNTDWRWISERSDSPWYPTMHIFKQERPFDWESAMNNLHTHFFKEVHQKNS
jgi:tetratricopeptide (TPR) repeat protein